MISRPRKLLLQEPRLIERYVRLHMHKKARIASRLIMRHILPFKERKRKKAIDGALSEIARQRGKSQQHGFESSAVLFNIALFFLIAERDIQAVKVDALTHPDPWKRSLCTRIILLTIHELDMDKVAGNKLRDALADTGVSNEAKRQATQALRAIRNAQQKARKQFSFLRNATIAHRDSDVLLQYRAISGLDEVAVLKIASEFYEGAHMFLALLPDLMLRVGTLPGLLKQMKSRAEQRST